jgi:ankyrin repeat protein
MIAIREENLPIVMILLDRGAEVNPILPNVVTPLMFASQKTNSPEIVTELLNRGANLEASLGGSRTSLLLAIEFGKINNAKILLEGGANPNSEDIGGKTALIWAAQKSGATRDTTLIEDLIRRDADIDAVDNRGKTVLDYAMIMTKPISKILEQAREERKEIDSLTQAMSELTLEESQSTNPSNAPQQLDTRQLLQRDRQAIV